MEVECGECVDERGRMESRNGMGWDLGEVIKLYIDDTGQVGLRATGTYDGW